jgi:hypothetical protein
MDHVRINGFTDNGINIDQSATARVVISDTNVRDGDRGIRVTTAGGRLDVSLSHVVVSGAGTGIEVRAGNVTVTQSAVTANANFGVRAMAGAVAVDSSMVSGNGVGLLADADGTLRLSNSSLYYNGTAIACGAGQVLTTGDNRKGGNGAACNPTGTVTVQ